MLSSAFSERCCALGQTGKPCQALLMKNADTAKNPAAVALRRLSFSSRGGVFSSRAIANRYSSGTVSLEFPHFRRPRRICTLTGFANGYAARRQGWSDTFLTSLYLYPSTFGDPRRARFPAGGYGRGVVDWLAAGRVLRSGIQLVRHSFSRRV